MSATFLSDEWFAQLAARLETGPPLSGEGSLRLGQLVTGAPEGERSWTVRLEGGSPPRLVADSLEEADVVLVESYHAALRLASGEASAAALLEAGEITVRGDANALVRAIALVEQVAPSAPSPPADED